MMEVLANYLAELVNSQLEDRKPMELPQEIVVEQIIEIASRNHMDYLLLGALLKLDNLSDEHKAVMKKCVMVSLMRTMTQVAELKAMEKRFEEAGVKNQPMKGARMKFIYPRPEMREMSDIDVLIDADCMNTATDILKDMGYSLLQSIKHHDIYQKPPMMVVEAHRVMYDKTVDGEQHRYFSSFSKTILREGMKYTYDFNTEDFYVYMMAHMAKHFYAMGCGIRNLVDVYVYREKYGATMNAEYVKGELKKCGILEFTKHMEKLANIWLKGEKSSLFYDDLFQYMMDSGIYGKDENGIWNKFCEEKMGDKKVSRFQLKMWYWFPPLHYMAEYYPWLEERPYLLFWAWIVRGFNGIFKKKGTQKRQMINEIDKDKIFIYQNIYYKMQLRFK